MKHFDIVQSMNEKTVHEFNTVPGYTILILCKQFTEFETNNTVHRFNTVQTVHCFNTVQTVQHCNNVQTVQYFNTVQTGQHFNTVQTPPLP